MNKGIVFGVVFLFVCMSFTSISGIQINNQTIKNYDRGNILYVGGSGEGNYSRIQDAIDNASDGDTVFVYNDSSPYSESDILIDKPINLIGEDRDTTVLDDLRIWLENGGDGTNISRFNFSSSGITPDSISNIVISNNYFFDGGIGLWSDNSIIISNTFYNCGYSSIVVDGDNNKISDNIFLNDLTDDGREISFMGGDYTVISNNTFINYNKHNSRTSLELDYSDYNNIEGNEFNGYEMGIYSEGGNNNLISYNTFINNTYGTIIVGWYNKVINNNFINNYLDVTKFIFSFKNSIDSNYWDEWIGLKYPLLSFLPHFSFYPFNSFIDWHPAKEPYNITTTQDCGIE
jgi:parallel beta-helix repeat protein